MIISLLRTWLAAGAAFLAVALAAPAIAEEPVVGDRGAPIVFICLHGSAKSQMAAAHFNRIARERGLPFTAVSRGIQVDGSIPTRFGQDADAAVRGSARVDERVFQAPSSFRRPASSTL